MKENQVAENLPVEGTQLPDSFFEEHPVEQMSSAMMTHLRIEIKNDEEMDAEFNESMLAEVTPQGLQEVEREKAVIAAITDPEEPVRMMRQGFQPVNVRPLCLKIREMQEQTMPILLRRYLTSSQDIFLDVAAIAFTFVDEKWIRQLREAYPQIRDPYARANACLLFAEAEMEEEIPFLVQEYDNLSRECPDKDYGQYPLLGLNFLCD